MGGGGERQRADTGKQSLVKVEHRTDVNVVSCIFMITRRFRVVESGAVS